MQLSDRCLASSSAIHVLVSVAMVLGSILGAGNMLFLPVGKFYWIAGFNIPPRPLQEHQAHRTPKPSGHAVSSKATLSREHGPWFEPGSRYRLFWRLASFLVPARLLNARALCANFCTLCHFRNYCHLRTLQPLCTLPALPPLPALGGKFVHLEPNH